LETFVKKDIELPEFKEPIVVLDGTDVSGLLSTEEIALVRSEVKAKLGEEKKKAARKALMEKFLAEELAAAEPAQEKVEIVINTPPFATINKAETGVLLDGIPYRSGHRYEVTRRRAEQIREIEQNAWRHEDVTHGEQDTNAYRRMRREAINTRGVVGRTTDTGALLRF
jgi:hypothetical protein